MTNHNKRQKNQEDKRQPTVAIIGGGYTGLAAAHKLSKYGFSVTILERESKIGGLAVGVNMAGLPLEKIWHFIYKSDSAILDLADELEIRENLDFYESSISTYYDGKLYSFMSALDLLRFNPISFIDRLRTGFVAAYLQRLNKWEPLQKITALEWMRKNSGERATKVIWEPLLKGKFGSFYDKVLMSWLWKRIRVRQDSNDGGKEMLGYFAGGFETLTNALIKKIEQNGVVIRTGVTVDKVIKNINETATVEYKTKGGIAKRKEFDYVIATVPTHIFADLVEDNPQVTNEYIQNLNSIDYVGAIVMLFVSEQKISDFYWHNVNDDNIPFLALLAETELVGDEFFDGKHVYYVGYYAEHDHPYYNKDKEYIMEEWEDGLKKMFPDFDKDAIIEKDLYKFKYAQHIVDIGYKKRIPEYQSPLGCVYLGNFSQIYPDDRGLNYAVLEGYKIADMITKNMQERKI